MRGREGDREEQKRRQGVKKKRGEELREGKKRRGEEMIKTANGFLKASLPDRHPLYVHMASVLFPSAADPTMRSIQESI